MTAFYLFGVRQKRKDRKSKEKKVWRVLDAYGVGISRRFLLADESGQLKVITLQSLLSSYVYTSEMWPHTVDVGDKQ